MKHLLCILLVFGAFQLVLAQQKTKPATVADFFEGEMLVQLNEHTSIEQVIKQLPSHFQAGVIREVSAPMRLWLLSFDHLTQSHSDFMRALWQLPFVSQVDYNHRIYLRETTPNDAQFSQQWHHVNTGQTGGTVDADIDSDLAWDITTGGTSASGDDIVVCVIESANVAHVDLVDNRWINTAEIDGNGIDDDGNGYVDDYFGWNVQSNDDAIGNGGHGTNCAGMIGATGNNTTGVAGVNWDVKIMVVAGYNVNSQANIISNYTYPLVMRQRWNNSNGTEGAFVVATSASWGIDNAAAANYPLWCAIYDTLGKYGILNVGATTNNTSNVDTNGDMPTTCSSPYMIGVGRTDHNDQTAGGFGVLNVDLGAPGINVRTTSGSNQYTTTTGTSFACPLTAGAIGLAYAIPCEEFMTFVKSDPQGAADLVLQALYDGTDVKSQFAAKFATSGRLNVKNTLDILMAGICSGSICLAPSGATSTAITENSATITWNAFSQATAYTLYYRPVGTSVWIDENLASTSFALADLLPCTDYEFYLESTCTDGTSNPSSVQTFRTKGCGDCIELPYCSSAASDASDEWIASVTIGTVSNNSGSDGGYGDFTGSDFFSFQAGVSYPLTITPGFSGSTYNELSRIWIDLNQDGVFSTGELLYNQGTASAAAASGTLLIPSTASSGVTRMRIQMAYQGTGQNTPPQVCGSFTYGEVEDYCVTILPESGVGVPENKLDAAWSIFPVPSNDVVKLQLAVPLTEVQSIEIIDLTGKTLLTVLPLTADNTLDVSHLSNGVYQFVLYSMDGSKSTKRFVIQR